MFAKLMLFACMLIGSSVLAETQPAEFRDADALDFWFSKNYLSHEIDRKENIVNGDRGELISVYGMRGSGLIWVDGWFYDCANRGWCELIVTVPLGEAGSMKSKPSIAYSKNKVIIKIGEKEIVRLINSN